MTSTTAPSPVAIVCEGWTRTVLLARELAGDVDPDRLSRTERLAVLALAPQHAEPLALHHFTAYAAAEQELTGIDSSDHSTEAHVRRAELAVEAATALNALLDGHPFAPEWTAGPVRPDPTYVADVVNGLREQLADKTEQVVRLDRARADLLAANLSLEQINDALRSTGNEPGYHLTEAGRAASYDGKVLALPVAAR